LENTGWFYPNDSDAVLVFVHGVLSNNIVAWKYVDPRDPKKECYWPSLIKKDRRFKDISIYFAGYECSVASGSYGIHDAAAEVYDSLLVPDPEGNRPVMEKHNIIFVCHSLGGIVTRYMLLKQMTDFFQQK
jgi:hypothetical protein